MPAERSPGDPRAERAAAQGLLFQEKLTPEPCAAAGSAAPAAAPPDDAQRRRIEAELDTTMLVEAAAGTGKTSSMMRRMVALLAEGRCATRTMAAVTFTRKAAAELRSRFVVALEEEARGASGPRGERLRAALAEVEQCFIGTIHSFCGRLLRERPVEAGVDVGFKELDELEDLRLRERAWEEHVAGLYVRAEGILRELRELGLVPDDLRHAWASFADYPDVQEWPTERVEIDEADLEAARRALRQYAAHAHTFRTALWRIVPRSALMRMYLDLPQLVRARRIERRRELIDLLEECASIDSADARVRSWPGGQAVGAAERDRWLRFVAEHATPLVEARRRQRYEPSLRFLRGVAETYRRLRRERGCLNFQDLLMEAAALLRDKPHVRRYFQKRFTHLLVDEFQDTDPIQAEVLLLLCSADHRERDWRRCDPRPGALFVVGDPKQSIYRFRRADIVTYNQVRRIFERCGCVVGLSASFRSIPAVIDWVNEISADLFPPFPDDVSPQDRPLLAVRPEAPGHSLAGAWRVDIPRSITKVAEVIEYEARLIAASIREAIDGGLTVPRTPQERKERVPDTARPGDFMIVTRNREPLVRYAHRLQEAGIPVEVTGGTAVNQIPEVALLQTVLAALLRPDDPVALVGALRSEVFGVSDDELYRFRRAGGRFDLRRAGGPPRGEGLEGIEGALARLGEYRMWLRRSRPVAAIERIAAHLGLFAAAAEGHDGADRAGGFCKAIELLRALENETWDPGRLVDYLAGLVCCDPRPSERHDGVPLRPPQRGAVRVMNLHQAKGLEAPVVFLAEGAGRRDSEPDLHIDRTQDTIRGFLAIRGPMRGWGKGRPIAQPPDWPDRMNRERGFDAAEGKRLLYVAATRARARVVVMNPTGGRVHARRLWEELADRTPLLPHPGEPPAEPPRGPSGAVLPESAPAAAVAAIEQRWRSAAASGHAVETVKHMALRRGRREPGGEHGTEWGSVVHVLLEAAMRHGAAGLERVARSALQEQGLDPRRRDEAISLVRSVMASPLWRRATTCTKRLVEVPIQYLLQENVAEPRRPPTIVRGVIDLAFREPQGWVIVDYKTDDRPGRPLEALIAHYAPQVRSYARAWNRAVGQAPHEIGLFFVNSGRYRTVDPADRPP